MSMAAWAVNHVDLENESGEVVNGWDCCNVHIRFNGRFLNRPAIFWRNDIAEGLLISIIQTKNGYFCVHDNGEAEPVGPFESVPAAKAAYKLAFIN